LELVDEQHQIALRDEAVVSGRGISALLVLVQLNSETAIARLLRNPWRRSVLDAGKVETAGLAQRQKRRRSAANRPVQHSGCRERVPLARRPGEDAVVRGEDVVAVGIRGDRRRQSFD